MTEPTTSQPPPGPGTTPAEPDLEIGQRVGEYEVERKLGQGGFGAVFKAVHPLIGKEVAIKVLARKFSSDPEMVSRFVAEARAVNQIRNRHIIDIFAFGQLEDGRHYYVMEILEGEPLDVVLDRGRLGLDAAIPILRPIARALDAAHAKGIAHRDLKPENIYLVRDPDGGTFPKLLDFGIAKLLGSEETLKHKTRTGAPIGTPYYMSPEQCRGRDVDHRTDIYAFGVLTYLMLTGVFPHDGDDYMTILMAQINDAPVPPSQVVGDLPPGIDDAVLWMMAKDPAARPLDLMTGVHALVVAAETAGIALRSGPASAAWDAQTMPTGVTGVTGGGPKYATPPPSGMRPTTAVTGPIGHAATMQPAAGAAVAAGTMRSIAPGEAAPVPSRSRAPMIAIAVLAAAAIGVVVFLAVGRGEHGATTTTTPPPTTTTGSAIVAPTPATITPDASLAVVPAISVDAGVIAPLAIDAEVPADAAAPLAHPHPHPRPHPRGGSATPSHDDIENPF